jgi:hypothetical protein
VVECIGIVAVHDGVELYTNGPTHRVKHEAEQLALYSYQSNEDLNLVETLFKLEREIPRNQTHIPVRGNPLREDSAWINVIAPHGTLGIDNFSVLYSTAILSPSIDWVGGSSTAFHRGLGVMDESGNCTCRILRSCCRPRARCISPPNIYVLSVAAHWHEFKIVGQP